MKYGSVVVQQIRNQLLRIDRCALRKLIQRNPAEVQIDSFTAQIIPAMEYAVQRDAVIRQRYLIIQAELVARLIAPREEDFTDCQGGDGMRLPHGGGRRAGIPAQWQAGLYARPASRTIQAA